MLHDPEVYNRMIKRDTIDVEAIRDCLASSQSTSWMRSQAEFLHRMEDSYSKIIADDGIGPLHMIVVFKKVVSATITSVERRLKRWEQKNRARNSRTKLQRGMYKAIAIQTLSIQHGVHTVQREPREKPDNPLLLQLGEYDPRATPEERALALERMRKPDGGEIGIDESTSKRQADELDAIFGVKPEDK